MTKASLVLPDGTRVTIDGTADEVASLLARFSSTNDSHKVSGKKSSRSRNHDSGDEAGLKKVAGGGPTDLIRELIDEGYFKTKRGIGEVRDKLEERAHIYPLTAISGPLYRLVKNKELRRLKEDGTWRYVNP
jgi:hypothetical protein